MRLAFDPDSPVVAVEPIWRVGMYNPQTRHGDIVVNGFVVSTYTEAVRTPTIAHALMTPVRFCFVAGSMVINRIVDIVGS